MEEGAAQGIARALQAHILLRRRQNNSAGRPGLGLPQFDTVSSRDAGVDALQAVESDEAQPFIFRIGANRDSGRVTLTDEFNDIAFLYSERVESIPAEPRNAASGVLGARIGHL